MSKIPFHFCFFTSFLLLPMPLLFGCARQCPSLLALYPAAATLAGIKRPRHSPPQTAAALAALDGYGAPSPVAVTLAGHSGHGVARCPRGRGGSPAPVATAALAATTTEKRKGPMAYGRAARRPRPHPDGRAPSRPCPCPGGPAPSRLCPCPGSHALSRPYPIPAATPPSRLCPW